MAAQKKRDDVRFQALRRNHPDFTQQEQPLPPLLQEYLDYYVLPLGSDLYWFGYIECEDYLCAAHLTIPEGEVKGTVLLIHGFLSHFGFYQDMIPRLLENGWAVAGLDLPGHGLSTGTPTGIEDFSVYGTAVQALVDTISHVAPKPFAAIGHSMGCASLLEYRLQGGNQPQRYIFIAPLVRSTMFGLSQFGFSLMQPFVETLPRVYQKTTGDSAYLEFKELHDPLQSDRVDPSWVRALFNWNSRIEETDMPSMELVIIQGDQDRVVDFTYNLDFLSTRILNTRVYMISGARHELPKEIPLYKDDLFRLVLETLNRESTDGR
jgi:alpha-beta hydrolase superfamily lysophospholipase